MVLLLSVVKAGAAPDLRLIEAVRSGKAEAVRTLLRQKVDVNTRQADGATALHWAAYLDDLTAADLLIKAGADVNAVNENGATPIYLACENGSTLMVGRLLQAGASANATLPSGETALMTAARSGSVGAVKALLAKGANINAQEKYESQNALMWAVSQHHPDVVKALIEGGADIKMRSRVRKEMVNMGRARGGPQEGRGAPGGGGDDDEDAGDWIDEGGLSPFLFAARVGDVESAKLLLEAGADINDTRPEGASALVVAAHGNQLEMVKFLLDRGAQVDHAGAGYTALLAAVLRGNPEMVDALIAKGADVNRKLEKGTVQRRQSKWYTFSGQLVGATPLFLASKFDEPKILRSLIAAGAKPDVVVRGQTPLMVAAGMGSGTPGRLGSDRRGRSMDTADSDYDIASLNKDLRMFGTGSGIECVKQLVELGADVNAASPTGDTALHAAAAHGYDSVIKYLVDKGAKLDAKNKRGQTPLDAALAMKNADDPTIGTTTVEFIKKLEKDLGIAQ
jgi:ankyrin repeat protein